MNARSHARSRTAGTPDEPIAWGLSLPFILIHLAALGVFVVGARVEWVLAAGVLYVVRMWAVTAGYHRYFSHRSFKTSRVFQFFLAFLAQTSVQKGALWWAAHHRHHHRYSDMENDVHSPIQHGFFWSHVGWILRKSSDEFRADNIKDFTRYPELVWLNRFYWVPAAVLAAALYAVGGVGLWVWGFAVSTVFLWHGTFVINSLTHLFGKRRYETTDDSRNSLLFALVTLGEGWHNNHHHYQSSCRQGFYWWEIDLTYYVLKVLELVGIVWDVREPPARVLAEGRANDAARKRPAALEAEGGELSPDVT